MSLILQDGISPLDWGRWEIYERSLLNLSDYVPPESNFLSVSDVSNAPLTFDGVIPFLNVCGDILRHRNMHSDQLPEQAIDLLARSESTSTLLIDRRETSGHQGLRFKMVYSRLFLVIFSGKSL